VRAWFGELVSTLRRVFRKEYVEQTGWDFTIVIWFVSAGRVNEPLRAADGLGKVELNSDVVVGNAEWGITIGGPATVETVVRHQWSPS